MLPSLGIPCTPSFPYFAALQLTAWNRCNDIKQIREVYGVEAARHAIIEEVRGIFLLCLSNIKPSHITLPHHNRFSLCSLHTGYLWITVTFPCRCKEGKVSTYGDGRLEGWKVGWGGGGGGVGFPSRKHGMGVKSLNPTCNRLKGLVS